MDHAKIFGSFSLFYVGHKGNRQKISITSIKFYKSFVYPKSGSEKFLDFYLKMRRIFFAFFQFSYGLYCGEGWIGPFKRKFFDSTRLIKK